MTKAILSLILTVLTLHFTAQNNKFDLIQKTLNAPEFVNQVNKQIAFNKNKPLTIYLDSSLIFKQNYTFNNKDVEYYDITNPTNRISPTYNFIFNQLNFGEKKVEIGFTFYPNWLIRFQEKEFPSYNNSTVMKVHCILIKNDNKWTIKNTTITDIYFPKWMYEKGSGFDYISNNYIPLGK